MIQISDFACALFCVTVNGFSTVLFWYFCRKIMKHFGYWKQTFTLLKILILTILIPWQYIPFKLYEMVVIHGWWRIIPQYDIDIALSGVLLVWSAGTLIKGRKVLRPFFKITNSLKKREAADEATLSLYREIAAEMSLRHLPRLYITDNRIIPFLLHSFPATIYLPENLADREHLEVSLRHELMHYLHKDHVWAWLLRICTIIQWWNPFLGELEYQYSEWSEYANDSDNIGRAFGKSRYFGAILDVVENYKEENAFAHGLGETQSSIERRIMMLSKGRKTKRENKGWLVNTILALTLILCVLATLLVDNVSTYAYYIAYQEASQSRDEIIEYIPVEHMEIQESGFPENMKIETGEVDYGNSTRSIPSFSWDVAGNTAVTSNSFYLKKGQQVMISIGSTTPSGISVKFGVLRVTTNTKSSITAPAPVSYSFTASAAGYYKVFVENTGTASFSVYGAFMVI